MCRLPPICTLLAASNAAVLVLAASFGADASQAAVSSKLAELDIPAASFDADAFQAAVSTKLAELGIPGAGITLVFANEAEPRSFGFGTANKALGTQVDAARTLFIQASVSKIVPGTLAAMLLSRGTISLDADISTYLNWGNDLRVRNNNLPITIRQLMTHSSGLVAGAPMVDAGDPSLAPTGINGAVGNPTCPLDKLEAWFKDLLFSGNRGGSGVGGTEVSSRGGWHTLAMSDDNDGLWKFDPGSNIEYSNLGASLLCQALAAAHGAADCAALSQELIFTPLNMTSTSWFMGADYASNAAMQYDHETGNAIGHWCFIDYPSGQLRTTAADMGKLLKVLLNRGILADGNSRLFDEATATRYFQCQTPAAAVAASDEFSSCPLAFQWFLDLGENVGAVEGVAPEMMAGGLQHEGQIAGVDTFAAVMPGAGFAFAIMTNTEEGASGLLPTVVKQSLLQGVDSSSISVQSGLRFWLLAATAVCSAFPLL